MAQHDPDPPDGAPDGHQPERWGHVRPGERPWELVGLVGLTMTGMLWYVLFGKDDSPFALFLVILVLMVVGVVSLIVRNVLDPRPLDHSEIDAANPDRDDADRPEQPRR